MWLFIADTYPEWICKVVAPRMPPQAFEDSVEVKDCKRSKRWGWAFSIEQLIEGRAVSAVSGTVLRA